MPSLLEAGHVIAGVISQIGKAAEMAASSARSATKDIEAYDRAAEKSAAKAAARETKAGRSNEGIGGSPSASSTGGAEPTGPATSAGITAGTLGAALSSTRGRS